jgi:hypothetical protein
MLTSQTTRMRVVASDNLIFKDSATEVAIVDQTATALDHLHTASAVDHPHREAPPAISVRVTQK